MIKWWRGTSFGMRYLFDNGIWKCYHSQAMTNMVCSSELVDLMAYVH